MLQPTGSATVAGFFQTMRKQFTAHEWQTIKSQESEWKQLEMFYRHWVIRNATTFDPAKTSVLLYCYAFGSFSVPEGELCKGNWNWYRA